ncbi:MULTISPECIES: cell division topological specificity factor MinE [unclassified Mesorhizobium]|uniref:cell division topological specificity factor MinE n=1 Tax=unclassified Mesorhizobium TaxID=325217 RepID=UPI003337256E
MNLLDIFKRRGSAPVARERLQLLLAYERRSRNQPDLVSVLREEIMAVIARQRQHVDVMAAESKSKRRPNPAKGDRRTQVLAPSLADRMPV